MIVVDSSVWIDFLNKINNVATAKLLNLESLRDIVLGDIMLFEILRGARDDGHARRLQKELRSFGVTEILNEKVAVQASANYRRLRAMGVTTRKMADVIISTYCIINGYSLLHRDRDFLPMVEHLGLKEF
jgi:predicted nucleic acid-binding protein